MPGGGSRRRIEKGYADLRLCQSTIPALTTLQRARTSLAVFPNRPVVLRGRPTHSLAFCLGGSEPPADRHGWKADNFLAIPGPQPTSSLSRYSTYFILVTIESFNFRDLRHVT